MISVVSFTLAAEDRREAKALGNFIFADLFVATLQLTNDKFAYLSFLQLGLFEY